MYFAFLFFSILVACEDDVIEATFSKPQGNFADTNYLREHEISLSYFSYSSSESDPSHPISKAFIYEEKNNDYWVSKDPINDTYKPYILFNFEETFTLEGFILKLAYSTKNVGRFYYGAPLQLNVYSSLIDEPLKLNYYFTGAYDGYKDKGNQIEGIQFVFSKPIECDSLKIEFLEVTKDESFSQKNCSVVRNVTLVEYIDVSHNVEIVGVKDNYADEAYVAKHQIPTSFFSYYATGDKDGRPITNLFDGKDGTYWVSREPNQGRFVNYLVIDFQQEMSLEGFLYDTAYRTSGKYREFDGFPTTLKIYTSTDDQPFAYQFQFVGKPVYPWTRIQFIFPQPITCQKLKLEFKTVTKSLSFAGDKMQVTCAELILLQHITEDIQETADAINNIFTDYAQFNINPSITDDQIEQLKQKAKNFVNYETEFMPIFERIDSIKKGYVKKDPHREFSTKPGSRNMLEQYGNAVYYSQQQLLLNSFSTNRQAIGIGGNTGKSIVIYVDVEPIEGQTRESVQLPRITFSQICGSWQSSFRDANLKLGRNSFVFPDIQTQGYSQPIAKGGPIHVQNPYNYTSQGGHVTIYVEGGYVYPVFHDGDDEDSFRVILKNYYKRLNDLNDEEITVDAFEAVSNHVMTSCRCSMAYDYYITRGYSPQDNINRWDIFLGKLLAFGGIPFDKSDQLYNSMNEHLRQNFRVVQPYAGFFAFAWTEMVGLPDPGTHPHCVYLTVPGWAFAHEFGHTVDKKGRIWGENTNNMWSMYNIFMMNREIYDRIPITQVAQHLGPDLSDYVTHINGSYEMGANPTIWWILEGAKPGYWAHSENMFIYEKSDRNETGASLLGMTERFVYYASLIFGHNMSYYFERWGFCMNQDPVYNVRNRWTYENSTQVFKDLLNQAKEDNKTDNVQKKYWYVNLGQYEYLYDHDNNLTEKEHCYDENEFITPSSITKNGDHYLIIFPSFKCYETHLCYEVQSFINDTWYTLGNTYTQTFTDTYDYQDRTPQYRVYAYDRLLDHTGDPPQSFTPQVAQPICKINDTTYETLQEAIDSAENNDTIILLRSFMLPKLILSKRVTIIPDESLTEPITITKINPGDLIQIKDLDINKAIPIQIGSNSRVKIILDGGGFKQAGSIISIHRSKYLRLYNVEIVNSITTGEGGAIYINYNGYVSMDNCLVHRCSSEKSGGAIYLCGGHDYAGWQSELYLFNTTFRDNTAKESGGAIIASGLYGHSDFKLYAGTIFENNVAGKNGGAIYAREYIEAYDTEFIGNKAINGGAIYIYNDYRNSALINPTFCDNIATNLGSDIYMEKGTLKFNQGSFTTGTVHKIAGSIFELVQFNTTYEPRVPDFSDAFEFALDLPDVGATLFDQIDQKFVPLLTEETVNKIPVQNGKAVYNSTSNTIVAYRSKATVTVHYNGQSYTFVADYGNFILPPTFEGFPQGDCILEYTKESTTYKVGDTILINGDCEFTVTVQRYCVVIFKYGDKQTDELVIPGTDYYMPLTTPDDEIVFGWDCSDGNYYAYADPLRITTDLTFTAVLYQKVNVKVQIGDSVETTVLNYNDFFVLPIPPEILNGLPFKYFYSESGGIHFSPNETIQIANDIKIIAFYSDKLSVSFVAGESRETKEYAQNTVITLHVPGPEIASKPNTGREFLYWIIDNEKYYAYTTYKLTNSVAITAMYGILNKTLPIDVHYELPQFSEEYPHYFDGTITNTESHSYLDKITFHGPEYYSPRLGYDRETQKEIVFDYWLINNRQYFTETTIGVTETINAALVTKTTTKFLPTRSPLPITEVPDHPLPITEVPDHPFKTPEELEILEIKPNGNTIDTTTITFQDDKEFVSKITTDDLYILGNGHNNLYIEINNNKEVEIKETQSMFGVKMNKDIKIKLNQEKTNMNVKGSGTLTISTNDNVQNVQLNGITVVDDSLVINTNQIDSLGLNNLQLYGNALFHTHAGEDQKPATVKAVNVYEGATAQISNLEVVDKVHIELNAVLTLNQVNLQKVNEIVIGYMKSNERASITGKIGSPPLKIHLVEMKSSLKATSLEKTKVIIASAPKEEFTTCNEWKDAVETEGTIFGNVECVADGSNMNLVAVEDKKEEESSKNLMPIIIGAAVGVVVIIVIIIIVVCVVRRRKMHLSSNSSEQIIETHEDDDVTLPI